jgi:hypothetical protein
VDVVSGDGLRVEAQEFGGPQSGKEADGEVGDKAGVVLDGGRQK